MFTIAAAAAELGTHPSHLARVFSQTYGIAPHNYLVGRRVDLARRCSSTAIVLPRRRRWRGSTTRLTSPATSVASSA
ncbi:helix-turn-helix transcriptional regulator [Nocardioides sp. NPDC057772]|uniref:helix-turn-helix transcriptional regulator n=1 Tax=Nocardioides sp. NPDC057772 TaxID=3346245 RepID=UPI00367354E6